MTTIIYEEASKELEELKEYWIEMQKFIHTNYKNPAEMIKVPNRISQAIAKENELSRRIRETWLEDSHEKIALRNQYKEVIAEFEKAQKIATDYEKNLLGMATPQQNAQIEKIKSSMTGNSTAQAVQPKKTKIIVETTEKATSKTHKVMRETFGPAFKKSNEAKSGEVTVTIEEE